ncbi:DUF2637 domain-containing protein [Kitasatospora sp. YST-16]|uniref:DUF2637 domain-containing protein n=1 Tax=Kitasatospora sp. YST-16 TaxID=2998080 RepID=UPI002283F694|nr:DUF2637 domain-containing protein [Kitasatospora sp. YST-16]WAL72314.1 DUF2637 domain-containing protein [Kitasatospora sp. YST-16]WNW38361.1 DUF2637 domain-containing protein [Streptomyces sp. Li-HN-5-13]
MRRLPKLDAVLLQAAIAAALSFAHLHDLAEAAGQTGWKAWAYPVSVDLLLVAAWRRLRSRASVRLAWVWFVIALAASLGANIGTAGLLDLGHTPTWLRIIVAGWPAAAFLGGTLLVHSAAHTPVSEPAEFEAEEDLPPMYVVEPEPQPEPEPAAIEEPEPVPALAAPPTPSAPPPASPVSAPAPATATPVPPFLLDHARKLADDHRARTGSPIDASTLRARLGIADPLASALAAELT